MQVQTDLRAGGGNSNGHKRCECGWSFYFLNDWNFHVKQNQIIVGNNNDHNEWEYED